MKKEQLIEIIEKHLDDWVFHKETSNHLAEKIVRMKSSS